MDGACSVVRLMNGVTTNIRGMDNSDQMEMNRVATKLEGLAHVEQLDVFNSSDQILTTFSVNHYMSTVLVVS